MCLSKSLNRQNRTHYNPYSLLMHMFSNINHKLGIFADNQWSFLLRAEGKKTCAPIFTGPKRLWYQPLFGISYEFILTNPLNSRRHEGHLTRVPCHNTLTPSWFSPQDNITLETGELLFKSGARIWPPPAGLI